MTERPLSVCLNYSKTLSYKEKARLIAEAGFDSVFLFRYRNKPDGDLKAQAEAARAEELGIETVHADFKEINSIWAEGEQGEELTAFFEKCIRETAELKISVMVIHLSSGNFPPAFNELGLGRYRKLCNLAEELGVCLAFENLRKTSYLDFILEKISSPNAKFCFDCGHENLYNGGAGVLEQHADRLACLHLHDNFGDKDRHLLPFDGSIDWERIAKRLSASNFKCPITLEVHSDDYVDDDFIRKAYERGTRIRALIGRYDREKD
ncbi:MAG: sugar phosphate isomerase/epimerase [Clostridia bacterium]|nr:sugar phosphate isomerase/epimerase [Clostridia bacterium]